MVDRVYNSVRGVRAPSIGDPEPLPRELKHLKPAERPTDKYDALYADRVAAGQVEHKTSKQRWREAELKKQIAKLEIRAVAARGSGAHYIALCVKLQNLRYTLRKLEAGRPQ